MFHYTVKCRFTKPDAPELEWLAWLHNGHMQDVIDSGALSATIVRMDDDIPSYEIRYEFESRKAFETYEDNHAPRLREEGLAKFPLTLGLEYQRSTGETVNTQN